MAISRQADLQAQNPFSLEAGTLSLFPSTTELPLYTSYVEYALYRMGLAGYAGCLAEACSPLK